MNLSSKGRCLAAVLFFIVIGCSHAQELKITEIAFEDWNLSDGEEWGNGWIELKNVSNRPLHTAGMFLKLNEQSPWPLPDISIDANEYLLIWLSEKNQNTVKENLHASFSITQDVNVFTLYESFSNIAFDSVVVRHKMDWNESRTRFPEDGNSWYNTPNTTPGYENVSPGPWRRVASYADFSPRDSAPNSALYFQGKLWIMEGWNGGGGEEAASSNVWASTDGSDWTLVNDAPPYEPYSAYTVFKNKMWAFDGNAYCSVDGNEWLKVASDLPFSTNSRVVELRDTLFLIKGQSIYKSPDGIVWNEVTASAPWEHREFPALVQFKDKLWLYGGGSDYNTGSDFYYNDVWSSEDGAHWERVVEHAPWTGRLWFGFASFDNKMWLFGGWNYHDIDDGYVGNKNDVWFTEDGIIWKSLATANSWQPRHAPLVWSSPDALFLSSGYLNNFGLFNDTWRLDRSENIVSNSFYLKHGANPRLASSWGSNKNGTGVSPVGFNYAYQKFIISNDDSLSIDNDFAITGQNSNLVVGSGQAPIYVHVPEAVNIVADVRMNALTTIEFEGNQRTPLLRSLNEQSTVIIGEGVTLDAGAIGQLLVKGAHNTLVRASFIRKSVTLSGKGTISSDTRELQYAPSSSLIYDSTSDRVASPAEWPSKRPPSNVVINCNCLISREGSVSLESLTLINGLLEISNGVLSSAHVSSANGHSYVITGSDGYLETIVHSDQTLFPIGTRESYNPVEIKLSNENVTEERFKVSVFPIDDATNSEYAINVGWKVFHASSTVPEYEIVFHWNARNENEFATPGALILVQSNETGDITSRTGASAKAELGKKIVSSIQSEVGMYLIQDSRYENDSDDIGFFPNPSIDHIKVLFGSGKKADVQLQLLDLSGRIIHSSILPAGSRVYRLNWNQKIPMGVYLLKFDTGKSVVFKKIVIE